MSQCAAWDKRLGRLKKWIVQAALIEQLRKLRPTFTLNRDLGPAVRLSKAILVSKTFSFENPARLFRPVWHSQAFKEDLDPIRLKIVARKDRAPKMLDFCLNGAVEAAWQQFETLFNDFGRLLAVLVAPLRGEVAVLLTVSAEILFRLLSPLDFGTVKNRLAAEHTSGKSMKIFGAWGAR